MKMNLYGIKDEMTEWTVPIAMANETEAKRFFVNQIRTNSIIKDNKGDFGLYQIGNYDSETGIIEAEKEPVKIMEGKDVVEK